MNSSLPRASRLGARRIAALLALQLGMIAVVLAATPFKPFELDRFFVPKELALHASVLLCVTLCIAGWRSISIDRVDLFLLVFGGLSLVSALLATNHWLALRSLAITFSGLAAFWCARYLSASGFRRPIMAAVVLATVLGAATSLAQAYGWESDYLTLSRAPGGTFGNRNFVAHLCAIGIPLLVWYAVTARRAVAVFLCAIGAAVLAAALVMSRSRAAWLAVLVVGVLLALPVWRAAQRVPHTNAARRLIFLGVLATLGVALSLLLPNRLNWKSDSPYLDSVRGVVDYNSGSGRGRLIQYRNTLQIVKAHPVLGVGPGNWPVYYPRIAARTDPSLSHDDDTTSNPWPSSDWVALVAERGGIAVVALLLAFVGLIANSFQASRGSGANNPAARDPFLPIAITATILVTAAVGSFDAVMLLAAPALIIWTALGAMAAGGRARSEWTPSGGSRRAGSVALLLTLAGFALRSVGQTAAMQAFGTGEQLGHVERAALLDPGSYRIQLRLAVLALNSRGCRLALPHARRASALLPAAAAPRSIVRRCGG
ncbi:MAG: O-antigen ligase family protein [Gemmatimonadota bacterium]|nr:O-antigen ligase family protein [Gemmatimonadota bacterium]